MDGDDETKEEDPVVREIEVHLADWGDPTDDAPRPGLALLQYPIRARERGPEPFDAARIKVRHELLEVDVPATKSGPHVDERAPERMRFDKRTLAATTVAPETNYAVGALRGGILRNCAARDDVPDAAVVRLRRRGRRGRRAGARAGVVARRPQAAGRLGQARALDARPVARPRELRAAPAGAGGRAVAQARGAPEGRGASRAKRAKLEPAGSCIS